MWGQEVEHPGDRRAFIFEEEFYVFDSFTSDLITVMDIPAKYKKTYTGEYILDAD